MKALITLVLFIYGTMSTVAQKEPLAPYLSAPYIPAFKIQLTDSSYYTKKDLPKNKFIVITYFNPECGHCQEEAKELSKHMDKFKKTFFVMAAYTEPELIKEFGETYGLSSYTNVRIGRDTEYFLPVFYKVKTTPFTAVYDKKGNLLKAFENGYQLDELQRLLK